MYKNSNWVPVLFLMLFIVFLVFIFLVYHAAENLTQVFIGLQVSVTFLILVLIVALDSLLFAYIGVKLSKGFNKLGCIPGYFFFILSIVGSMLALTQVFVYIVENIPCTQHLSRIIETPFNVKILAKCPFTNTLVGIMSDNLQRNIDNWPNVLFAYMEIFTQKLFIGIAFLSAILAGSYGVLWKSWIFTLVGKIPEVSRESEEDDTRLLGRLFNPGAFFLALVCSTAIYIVVMIYLGYFDILLDLY